MQSTPLDASFLTERQFPRPKGPTLILTPNPERNPGARLVQLPTAVERANLPYTYADQKDTPPTVSGLTELTQNFAFVQDYHTVLPEWISRQMGRFMFLIYSPEAIDQMYDDAQERAFVQQWSADLDQFLVSNGYNNYFRTVGVRMLSPQSRTLQQLAALAARLP